MSKKILKNSFQDLLSSQNAVISATYKFQLKTTKDGYRCRSAYKLLQIQEKYNLLEPGLTLMECGCAPGSWSQVAAKLINSEGLYDQEKLDGLLIGCDLLRVEPVAGAILLSNRQNLH